MTKGGVMATRTRQASEDVEEVIESNGAAKNLRLSITVDPSLRRHIRIAAALADMDVGEWCAKVLERYATKAVEQSES